MKGVGEPQATSESVEQNILGCGEDGAWEERGHKPENFENYCSLSSGQRTVFLALNCYYY